MMTFNKNKILIKTFNRIKKKIYIGQNKLKVINKIFLRMKPHF